MTVFGRVRLLESVSDLEHHVRLWGDDGKPGLVLLIEGADAGVEGEDVARRWQRGQ